MPSPEISFPSDKRPSSSGEPASDWSLAPITPVSEGASFAPAPGRAEDRSHALEQDGFGPKSFPASEPRETASEDAGGIRFPPARETKRDMARKRYKSILLLGVLPLFLSSVVAGIYVFRKVTGHAMHPTCPRNSPYSRSMHRIPAWNRSAGHGSMHPPLESRPEPPRKARSESRRGRHPRQNRLRAEGHPRKMPYDEKKWTPNPNQSP